MNRRTLGYILIGSATAIGLGVVVARSFKKSDSPQQARQANPRLPARTAAGDVVIYTTPWCPVCTELTQWLDQHGVAYRKRDVEADAQASAELDRKLAAAKIESDAVPVIDVGGNVSVGFRPDALAQQLGVRG